MSSNATDVYAAAMLSEITGNSYGFVVSAALLLFDYAITFSDEVELVWGNTLNIPTLLFLSNRVSIMLSIAGQLVMSWPYIPQESCKWTWIMSVAMQTPPYLVGAAFSAFRVYAITDHAILVTLLVLGLSLVPVAAQMTDAVVNGFESFTPTLWQSMCQLNFSLHLNVMDEVAVAGIACLIAADAIVLIVTVRKTYSVAMDGRAVGFKTPLCSMLLMDGSLYFAAATLANMYQLALYKIGPLPPMLSVIFIFENIFSTQTVTSIITTRFILALRFFSKHGNTLNATSYDLRLPTTMSNSTVTGVHFPYGILGEMGGLLDGNLGFGGLLAEQADQEIAPFEEPQADLENVM